MLTSERRALILDRLRQDKRVVAKSVSQELGLSEDTIRRDLREMAADVLLDKATLDRGYFREDAVRSLLTRHERNEADNSNTIWSLLVHELWHREFVDHGSSSSRPAGLVAA